MISNNNVMAQDFGDEYLSCVAECTPREEEGPRGRSGPRGIKGSMGDDCLCCEKLNEVQNSIREERLSEFFK